MPALLALLALHPLLLAPCLAGNLASFLAGALGLQPHARPHSTQREEQGAQRTMAATAHRGAAAAAAAVNLSLSLSLERPKWKPRQPRPEELAGEFAGSTAAAMNQILFLKPGSSLLRKQDFLFAAGTTPERYLLAQATRVWRLGIRTLLATNSTAEDAEAMTEANAAFLEHYVHFPDDVMPENVTRKPLIMQGATRMAMAPFLAHQHYGDSYKWLMYGDDDTLFYMSGVQRLLEHFDPEQPLAITDNLWFRSKPSLFAPRCLPCHFDELNRTAGLPLLQEAMDGYERFLVGAKNERDLHKNPKVLHRKKSRQYKDFRLAQDRISLHGPNVSVVGVRYTPRVACPSCTVASACGPAPPEGLVNANCSAASASSSGGIIFSVGLLRRIPFDQMKECLQSVYGVGGGAAMLSECLWRLGYAFTDPGTSLQHRYDGRYLIFGGEPSKSVLSDPLSGIVRGTCDSACRWLLFHAVSYHVRAREFATLPQAAAYMYAAMASYNAAHQWYWMLEDRKWRRAVEAAGAAGQEEAGAGGGRRKLGGVARGGVGAGAAAGAQLARLHHMTAWKSKLGPEGGKSSYS